MKWNIKKNEPKVNMTIRIDPYELKALDNILKQQGITRSVFLQSVISQYVKEKEAEANNDKLERSGKDVT